MSADREFRPELMPRKGEAFAWLTAAGLVAGLLAGTARWGALPFIYWSLAIFVIFSAASISLGNWMDRRSVLRLDAGGIAFENGLRSTRMTWPEVQNVAVVPTRLGRRVQVQSARSHFTFKTLGESALGGQLLRTGFAEGESILQTILGECGLTEITEKDGVTYYARP